MPTEADLRLICLEHFTRRQNFFDDVPSFYLEEPLGKAKARNLQFNAEFAKISGS